MKRCFRIIVTASVPDNFIQSFVQKNARILGLEGTAQLVKSETTQIRINACGSGEQLDEFIDLFHKGAPQFELLDIEIEPFLRDKDYRNVFRIIE